MGSDRAGIGGGGETVRTAWTAWAAGLWLATLLAGCGPTPPRPRVVAERVFDGAALTVSVRPYADIPEIEPRIVRFRYSVDRPAQAGRGESEALVVADRAMFTPPPGATKVTARLLVRQGDRTFHVSVPFRKTLWLGEFRWVRDDAVVRDVTWLYPLGE